MEYRLALSLFGLVPLGQKVLGEFIQTVEQRVPGIGDWNQHGRAAGFFDKHRVVLEANPFGSRTA
jgi:hypothetical protein